MISFQLPVISRKLFAERGYALTPLTLHGCVESIELIRSRLVSGVFSPRQRLYGAPYAFTLMPGTIIFINLPEV